MIRPKSGRSNAPETPTQSGFPIFLDVSNDEDDQAYIGVGLITRIDSYCGGMALISTTHGEATQTQLKLIDLAATLRRRGLVLQVEPDPVEPAQPEPQPAGRGPEQISVEQMLSRLN